MVPQQGCLICNGSDCKIGYDLDICKNYQFCDCPRCGKYIFGGDKYRNTNFFPYFGSEKNEDCVLPIDKLQSYIYYHKSDSFILLGNKDIFDEYSERKFKYAVKNVTKEEIENWYPKNFNDKINKILLWIASSSRYMGDEVTVSIEDLCLLFFMYNKLDSSSVSHDWANEFRFIIKYLLQNEFIGKYSVEHLKTLTQTVVLQKQIIFVLTETAWQKIYELQKNEVNSKKIFIAMSFNPTIEQTYNAIDSAIRQAKCEVVSMKHRIHNKQIVPEMLRLIKESKILVMDISEPNFGAYYEAGYAQGLGKEVIITCKSSVMKQDKFPCNDKKGEECELLKKYSKPHFDIAQKQILVWEDETDLTEQLTEWIKFLIG